MDHNMRAKFVYESLNEEFLNEERLGIINAGKNSLGVYKNPRTVKRMDYWARAISTNNGDFYVMTLENDQMTDNYDAYIATHADLSSYLGTNHIDIYWKSIPGAYGYGYYKGGIAWQRYNNSDKWYICESTSDNWIKDNMDYIKDQINKVNKHNIQYLKLIPMSISKMYDNTTEFAESDEYYREQEKEMY
jgi:hypothetical protein